MSDTVESVMIISLNCILCKALLGSNTCAVSSASSAYTILQDTRDAAR